MEVTAHARYIRMSARKVRLVAGLIRGMDLDKAIHQLRFYRKAAARPVLKLVQSCTANAVHNNKLDPANLYISKITVDIGPSLKRFRPRAFGRAAEIKKHMCHINVTLAERKTLGAGAKSAVAAAAVKAEGASEEKAPKTKKPAAKKAAAQTADKKAKA
ncbi:MAG: hypothetical protein RLZZ324_107 [Candidatus Parcubacteria bacterium]|jgi:large subunit ribosomal protein L22